MSKNIAVYGIYRNRQMVEHAVEALKNAGFRNTDISVLFPESGGSKDFAIEKETKAPEGAATGAGTGAVIGGTLAWLTGIGLLAIPGLGPFIAAGPIMAALAGVGAGGVVGGIAGALIGMGIPEYEANRYEGHIKKGGILLSLHTDDADWKKKGKEILERTGAENVSSKGESRADYDVSDRPGHSSGTNAPPRTGYSDLDKTSVDKPFNRRVGDQHTSNTTGTKRPPLRTGYSDLDKTRVDQPFNRRAGDQR